MNRHDDWLPLYKHLRGVLKKLNDLLVKRLSKDVLHEGARQLGILHGNVVVFNEMNESEILMDYCIHDVWRNGRNAVQRYLNESPPLDKEELTFLEAMSRARFSLFLVERCEPGCGATLRDLLYKETIFLMNIALSSTARVGTLIPMRVFPIECFFVSTGARILALLPDNV